MAQTKPFKAIGRTHLLDGTEVGVPKAIQGNPLLEEQGFARTRTVEPTPGWPGEDDVAPNATLESRPPGSRVASDEPSPIDIPRALLRALRGLRIAEARREPEDGDAPFFIVGASVIAAGATATVLDVAVDRSEELFIVAVGSDMADGLDQFDMWVDGDVFYRGLYSPGTLSEARTSRLFLPPKRAKRSVQVKITNNDAAPATVKVILRGWKRDRVMGTVGLDQATRL